MKCPRCVQRIHRAAAACPHCGFSLADADVIFGGQEVKLRCLTDAAGLFRRDDRDKIEDVLTAFGARFPQMFLAVHTASLGEAGLLRQFGFWLLNRGVFEDVDGSKSNEGGIVLVIDPDSKSAGLSFGYLLDPFFEEKDSFHCLTRAHSHWLDGRYCDGVIKSLDYLGKLLQKRSRQARRHHGKSHRQLLAEDIPAQQERSDS